MFATDIAMEFHLEKCALIEINWSKITNSNVIEMPNGQTSRSHQGKAYKYLSVLQLDKFKHGQVKKMINEEYTIYINATI